MPFIHDKIDTQSFSSEPNPKTGAETVVRVLVGPVREENDIITIDVQAALEWLDNDGAIYAALLLQVGVRVIPVGSALTNGKLISKSHTRLNRWEADVRNAIHVGRHEHPMPVDGGFHAHLVMNVDAGHVSLLEVQGRAGDDPVDGHTLSRFPGNVHLLMSDRELVFDGYCLSLYGCKKDSE